MGGRGDRLIRCSLSRISAAERFNLLQSNYLVDAAQHQERQRAIRARQTQINGPLERYSDSTDYLLHRINLEQESKFTK